MPKKRKTRQQKMVTDQKKQGGHQMTLPTNSSTSLPSTQTQESIKFSLPTTTSNVKKELVKGVTKTAAVAITTNDYGYLKNDLLRTAFLTCAIVIAELLIRFMFRG